MIGVSCHAMETHFHVSPPKYQYFERFFEETLLKIKFTLTFSKYVLLRILLVQPLLGSVSTCDSPMILPSSH